MKAILAKFQLNVDIFVSNISLHRPNALRKSRKTATKHLKGMEEMVCF